MRYIAGLAFVGALLLGNFALALSIAAAALVLFGLLKLVEKFQRDSAFASFLTKLHSQLGGDWVAINLRDVDFPDPVALVFDPNSKTAHLVSADSYGSRTFRSRPVGVIFSVKVDVLRPEEVVQPNARIQIKCQEMSRKFNVSGTSAWQTLKQHFPSFDQAG